MPARLIKIIARIIIWHEVSRLGAARAHVQREQLEPTLRARPTNQTNETKKPVCSQPASRIPAMASAGNLNGARWHVHCGLPRGLAGPGPLAAGAARRQSDYATLFSPVVDMEMQPQQPHARHVAARTYACTRCPARCMHAHARCPPWPPAYRAAAASRRRSASNGCKKDYYGGPNCLRNTPCCVSRALFSFSVCVGRQRGRRPVVQWSSGSSSHGG